MPLTNAKTLLLLAVVPERQGRGIGGIGDQSRLHGPILVRRPCPAESRRGPSSPRVRPVNGSASAGRPAAPMTKQRPRALFRSDRVGCGAAYWPKSRR